MRNGLLTAYMEAGFSYLKQMANLPDGLMPDFASMACHLGDETMLEVAEPLGFCDRLKSLLAQAPDPGSLPAEVWQWGIGCWQAAN